MMKQARRAGRWRWTAVVVALCCASARGHWAFPESVPVSRLVKNLSAYVEEHPDDASGHYALARVHSMAYVVGTSVLQAYERDGEIVPSSVPRDKADPRPGPTMVPWQPKQDDKLDWADRLQHLGEAVTSFENAFRTGRATWDRFYSEAAGHLSYAYLIEQGASDALDSPSFPRLQIKRAEQDAKAPEVRRLTKRLRTGTAEERRSACTELTGMGAVGLLALWENREALEAVQVHGSTGKDYVAARIRDYWLDLAAEHYLEAHRGALKGDLNGHHSLSHSVRALVSYEAGLSYQRLAIELGYLPDRREAFDEVSTNLKRIEEEAQVGGAITPIIFPLDVPRPLESLLDSDAVVSFDLDGTGREQSWPWVRPDTAILCWDPAGTGRITSGRQLFGSVTWWVFFPNGYRALDALDDNRDGELAGNELAGIAVWRDSNGNGRSDPGEVCRVGAVGVKAISVVPDTAEGLGPACHDGIRMFDGRVLPTYDWIASPVSSDPAANENFQGRAPANLESR